MHLIELLIGTGCVVIYALARLRLQRQVLLADGVFIGLACYFYGAWFEAGQLDYVPGADEVLFLATLAMVGGALGGCALRPVYRGIPPILARPQPLDPRFLYATGLFIVLFNLAFAYVVYDVLLGRSLQLLTEERGLLSVRLLIATGEKGYFFPGLVKQVRDILAPVFLLYVMAYTPRRRYRLLAWSVGASTLLAMFLGGQRMPLLVFAWAAYLGRRTSLRWAGPVRPRAPRNWARALGYATLAVPVMAGVNALLGRFTGEVSPLAVFGNTVYGIFERLVLIVPRGSIETYLFITARELGFAQLWLADLAVLAPGTQSGISNQLHSYLGGSEAGNVVLGMPLGAYVNAGYAGVLLTPMVFLLAASLLDRRVAKMDSPLVSSARYVVLAYTPILYDPYIFLLNGGLLLGFCMLLAALRPLWRRRV